MTCLYLNSAYNVGVDISLCSVVPSIIIPLHVYGYMRTQSLGVHILPTQQSFSYISQKLRSTAM